ncbi:hypothetical protein DXG01_006501 [Tephrocybe rancida]|nr:hypothetical protein DXG01_006501 [Tephrocybe rancida]
MHAQTLLAPLILAGSALQNVSNILNTEIEAFIRNLLGEWNSPGGIAVAVVRRDVEGSWNVETKGYGAASYDGRKLTDKTRFAIASNSKLFTVLATGLLVNNETLNPRLSWTSKIAPLTPGWHLADKIATDHLTILDAMSHRSGLPPHDLSYKLSDNTSSIVEKMKHLRFSAEFRDRFQYCNTMYALLSTLPERVLPSKTSFNAYVKQHILDPLGMNATTYDGTGDVAEGVLRQNSHDNPFGNGTVRALSFDLGWNARVFGGAGGVVTNAVDMAIWLRTLLFNGKHPDTGRVVIPPEVVDKAATGISVDSGKARFPELSPVVYGGGQNRYSYRGHEVIEHSGGLTGHLSWIARLPDLGLGVMVYSNDNNLGGWLTTIIKYRLIDEALGLEPIDWNARYKDIVRQALLWKTTVPSRNPNITHTTSKALEALAGTYHNSGYGPFELCLVSPAPSLSASPSCKALAANAERILPGAIAPGVPTFLTEWFSPWATHLRFTHFAENMYNVSVLASVPTGNEKEPFWTLDEVAGEPPLPAWADFEAGGVGLMGIWGAGVLPEGKTVRERAEVWFERV